MLRLYNTLTRSEEEFVPIKKGIVTLYTCGPTVYSRPHVGNYASFLMADLLRRWLEAGHGFEVIHVKNITDVGHLLHDADQGDDKVQREAEREHLHPLEIAKRYEAQYLEDERALNILEPAHRPHASDPTIIEKMIEVTKALLERGYAYELDDGVYFAVESFPRYGEFSGNTLEDLRAGARISIKEGKKHPADFALWKKCVGENVNHILRWDSPWGEGFPGWHLECSVMGRMFFGDHFDIHTGGEDLIFPHHECEIAQSSASCDLHQSAVCASGAGKALNERCPARYWVHRRFIDLGKERMSKSAGNVLTLPDVIAMGYSPLDLRYELLSVHYRTRLSLTEEGLRAARTARRRVVEWLEAVKESKDPEDPEDPEETEGVVNFRRRFTEAMDSDINTPEALASVFECMAWSRRKSKEGSCRAFAGLIRDTFGCFEMEALSAIPPAIQRLVEEREIARKKGDFAVADRLRERINAEGYDVRDTGQCPSVSKI